MNSNSISDIELITNIKDHHHGSFNILYERYSQRSYDLAIIMVKDEDWAFDIVQDSFIAIWTNREKLLINNNIWFYIRTLIRNNSISKLREIKKNDTLIKRLYSLIDLRSQSNHDILVAKNLLDKYESVKKQLTPQQLAVFTLCREEGISHKKISELLDISTNTVKNHMVASMKMLRRHLHNDITYFLFLLLNFFKNL